MISTPHPIFFGDKIEKIRLAAYVASMGREEAYIEFWWGTLTERDHFEDPGVDGRQILRCISRKWDGGYGLE
jgi:hypothetical protein